MALKTEIVHHCRGRLRLKVPAAKGNEDLLEQIRMAILPIPGVTEVKVKPRTGSVVTHYDPHLYDDFHDHLHQHCGAQIEASGKPSAGEVDEMARQIEQEAEFLAEHSDAAKVVVDFFKALDRQVKIATGNAVDLKVLAPLGLAAFTFVELGLEAATPIWLTLGLFSLNHFVEMHAHPAGTEETPRSSTPEPEPNTLGLIG
jgi:hypothetical protein